MTAITVKLADLREICRMLTEEITSALNELSYEKTYYRLDQD